MGMPDEGYPETVALIHYAPMHGAACGAKDGKVASELVGVTCAKCHEMMSGHTAVSNLIDALAARVKSLETLAVAKAAITEDVDHEEEEDGPDLFTRVHQLEEHTEDLQARAESLTGYATHLREVLEEINKQTPNLAFRSRTWDEWLAFEADEVSHG